jgi:hypothetical protein
MQEDHSIVSLSSPESVLEVHPRSSQENGPSNVTHAIISWESRNIMGLDHQLHHLITGHGDVEAGPPPVWQFSVAVQEAVLLPDNGHPVEADEVCAAIPAMEGDWVLREGDGGACDPAHVTHGSDTAVAMEGASPMWAAAAEGRAERLPFASTSRLMAAVAAAASPLRSPPAPQPEPASPDLDGLQPLCLEDAFGRVLRSSSPRLSIDLEQHCTSDLRGSADDGASRIRSVLQLADERPTSDGDAELMVGSPQRRAAKWVMTGETAFLAVEQQISNPLEDVAS